MTAEHMDRRVQRTENLTCPKCGRAGKVTFSRPEGPSDLGDKCDRLERGCIGFEAEQGEFGFRFRCVGCNRNARMAKSN
jgi:hypothetical protein